MMPCLEILRRTVEALLAIVFGAAVGAAFIAVLWTILGTLAGLLQFLRHA